jgi:3-oxoadipate enol-lactonase
MAIIDIGDTRLNCSWEALNAGPALVLSNSLGSALDMWRPQVDPFCSKFRLLRYDTRGHGLSSVPPGPYTIAQLGSDVLRVLDAYGIERAHFCGLSMGGVVGMWLGVNAPDRIDRLVLCNTTPWLGPPDVMNSRIDLVRREGLEGLADATMERWFTQEFRAAEPQTVQRIRGQLAATSPEGYIACCEALRDNDLREELARIRAPTLVITGTEGPTSPPPAALAMAAAIPGARCIELPAAHLSNLGAAAAFNASVLGFLCAK